VGDDEGDGGADGGEFVEGEVLSVSVRRKGVGEGRKIPGLGSRWIERGRET